MSTEDEKPLTTAEAAEFLGVKPATMMNWRTKGVGPTFVRYGGRTGGSVVYLRSDLVAYREKYRVKPSNAA